MMRIYDNVPFLILDTKAAGDFDGWPMVKGETPPPIPLKGVQVWQPGIDDGELFDRWFASILHNKRPAVILIDEVSSITSGRGNVSPMNFQRLMKQGRGLNKCVINCTQEIAYIPRQMVTQTTHVVRFRLLGRYDQQSGNRMVTRENNDPEPKTPYGFFYARTDTQGVSEYEGHQQFF
jgi:hypothetical protein